MTLKECTIDNCTAKVIARGWCSKHYTRWQRNGDPLNPGTYQKFTGVEFDDLVDRTQGPESCWPWIGPLDDQGYGRWRPNGKSDYAHRQAWRQAVGEPPARGSGYVLDHTCHIPDDCAKGNDCAHRRCCNPAHLRLTTQKENASWERSSRNRDGMKSGLPCTVSDCGRIGVETGLCTGHVSRKRIHGDVFAHIPLGPARLG